MSRRPINYLDHLHRESRRFAAALAGADPAAPVPTCPDWTAADLLWHLTEVQWFWGTIVGERLQDPSSAEATKPARPDAYAELAELFGTATGRLSVALAEGADTTAVWTWASDRSVGFIRRRQAHEALIHRLDAELVGGEPGLMDAALSADGVDELLRVMWAELPGWATFTPSGGEVLLAATDTGDAWLAVLGRFTGTSPTSGRTYDEPTITVADPAPAAAPAARVRGTAAALDRWLWNRGDAGLERTGDPAALANLDGLVTAGVQ
jgi:uncharacterized protein (TIGR03083 family)